MSTCWTFYSAESERLIALLSGSADPQLARALVETLCDEGCYDFDDPAMAAEVAKRVTTNGLDYGSATEEEFEVLDCVPSAIVQDCEELADYLGVRPVSPAGAPFEQVRKLARYTRKREASITTLLAECGRRYQQQSSSLCEYIILCAEETVAFAIEVRELEAKLPWYQRSLRALVREELVGVVVPVAEAQRALVGLLP